MQTSASINFERIAQAIDYIRANFQKQPDLDEVAEKIHLSPFHFQRLFTEWAGVSPKTFLQYISIEYAKDLLREKQATLFDAANETGLSSTGRLHDLFIKIEGMTPGEYKNGGENLKINYSYSDTIFGKILVASTEKGICYIAFADDEAQTFQEFIRAYPKASLSNNSDSIQTNALGIFSNDWSQLNEIKLHLKGTDFQVKVWEALLKVPQGKLITYGKMAEKIGNPNASRAVGSAVGDNPVAFLIPCHRVIQSGGNFGQYHWGSTRKTAMIGWEAAHVRK